jgi:probable F420-dependent oxidoreductase
VASGFRTTIPRFIGASSLEGGHMTKLKFGMLLPVQSQTELMSEPWESGGDPNDILSIARTCEENGFDNVSVCDHVAIPRELAPTLGTTWYDPVATLGWLAGQTSSIRLLSQVYVLPYRHPLQIAKTFSTLDALSDGRVILGVGVGYLEAEFETLGVSFADRAKTASRAIPAIRAAFADEWGSGNFGQRPRPRQPGGPPIWVGGSSPAARRRAAALGDGWLPEGPPEHGMTSAIAEINALREQDGRADTPFAMGATTVLYVGEPTWESGPCVAGGPTKLAEYLDRFASIGASHVQVRFRARDRSELTEQIVMFARDVVTLLN